MKRFGLLMNAALFVTSLIAFGGLAAAMQTMGEQIQQKVAQ